jgi:hypothetical protein
MSNPGVTPQMNVLLIPFKYLDDVVEGIKLASWKWLLVRKTPSSCLLFEWCENSILFIGILVGMGHLVLVFPNFYFGFRLSTIFYLCYCCMQSTTCTPFGYYYKQIWLFWYIKKVMYLVHNMDQIHHFFNYQKSQICL